MQGRGWAWMDQIKATMEAMNVQRKKEAVWFTAFASRSKGVKHVMGVKAALRMQPIRTKKLYQAQREDWPLEKWLNKPQHNQQDTQRAPPLAWMEETTHWGKWNPLSPKWLKSQLVLPHKFHRTVFRELHEEMGHLEGERVLHLTRERSFWPHMKGETLSVMSHVCAVA